MYVDANVSEYDFSTKFKDQYEAGTYKVRVKAEAGESIVFTDGDYSEYSLMKALLSTANMAFELTTPESGVNNTIAQDEESKTCIVNVVNGIVSVEITGTKAASQTIEIEGAH